MKLLVVSDAWIPRSTAWSAPCEATNRELRARRPHGRDDRARPVPHRALPELSARSGCRCCPWRRLAQRIAAARPDAIHIATEGPLGLAARALLRAPRPALHHRVSHALPAIPDSDASACRRRWVYGFLRRFHGAADARAGRRRSRSTRDLAAHRLDQHRALDARRRPRRLPARQPALDRHGPAGAGVPLRRPRRRSRRTSRPSSSSTCRAAKRGRRRRPASCAACRRATRTCISSARCRASDLARHVRERRRVRVPEPHRHLRPGDARGARLRHAGGGLPGAGPARRRRRQRRGGARCRPALRRARRAAHRPARAAGSTRSASRGVRRRASSSICNRPSTAPRRRIACLPPESSPPPPSA